MASKSETKRLDGQVGNELGQLEAAAVVIAETINIDPGGGFGFLLGQEDRPSGTKAVKREYPPIVRKQANRLLRLFQLQPGHEGRAERIAEYQLALSQNGVKTPPVDIETAYSLIREVGEYHG